MLLLFSVGAQARDGWERVGPVESVKGPAINYVQFFDDETGVIAGDNGVVRYTTNGGTTWRDLKLPQLSDRAREDIIAGSWRGNALYLLTSRRLLKSKNRGNSWEVLSLPRPPHRSGPKPDVGYFDMTFISERDGWVLCGILRRGDFTLLGSYLLRTNDGGQTWGTTDLKTGRREMRRMHFADRNHGWIVGDEGTILHTEDGERWESQQFPVPEGERVSAPRPKLNDVDFKKGIGIIVGQSGTILQTEDGGEQWFLIRPRDFKARVDRRTLYRVHIVDREYAWAVGKSGGIFVTRNGGISWSQQNSPTETDLFDVFMPNREEGWAAGANMTLLKYDADDRGRDDRGPGRGRRGASAATGPSVNSGAYHE